MMNAQRGAQRQRALAVRLADSAQPLASVLDTELVVRQVDVAAAWLRLSAVHQEALALAVFDGLTAPRADGSCLWLPAMPAPR